LHAPKRRVKLCQFAASALNLRNIAPPRIQNTDAMRTIETPRCAAMKSGEDQALCELDLGFLGLSGPEALNQLLAMQPGVPILVGGGRAIEAGYGAGGVHPLVRRSHSLEAFRLAISRLRRTGAAMYLKLEY
jgi:hypothetical protein